MRYENISTEDLKARIAEIKDILTWPETKKDIEAEAAIKGDLKELEEALKAKENKMIQVIIENNPETAKLEAKDIDGTVHQANKRLSDLKTALRKKGGFEIVEKFEEPKRRAEDKKAEKRRATDKPKAEKAPKAEKKKGNTYEDRKAYVIAHFEDADLHSKSPKIAKFCKKFDLTLTKAGRNLTFEKTLDKMSEEGIVDYVPTTGKYKKLEWYYTEDHVAAMNPDDEL